MLNEKEKLSIQDFDKIQEYIIKGLISERVHPDYSDIHIYNYTQKAQFDRIWDEYTINCRGLIVNTKNKKILAKSFQKFFNVEEHLEVFKKELPDEEPIITTKEDGSLGILVWLNDEPWIATRGSFCSEQAIWATHWFRKNVDYSNIPKELTLLFEIVYAQNRIVIQYDFEGLIFLAAIDTKTGRQVGFKPNGVRIADSIPNTDILKLAELDEKNKEGFVVFYPKSNLRLKIKFPEYVRMHKILTGLSVKGIWEYFVENGIDADIKKIAENMPDEFFVWLIKVSEDFKKRYKEIEYECVTHFNLISYDLINITEKTRKDWATLISKTRFPGILFLMLDGKDYSKHILKLLKPCGAQTFKNEV